MRDTAHRVTLAFQTELLVSSSSHDSNVSDHRGLHLGVIANLSIAAVHRMVGILLRFFRPHHVNPGLSFDSRRFARALSVTLPMMIWFALVRASDPSGKLRT